MPTVTITGIISTSLLRRGQVINGVEDTPLVRKLARSGYLRITTPPTAPAPAPRPATDSDIDDRLVPLDEEHDTDDEDEEDQP